MKTNYTKYLFFLLLFTTIANAQIVTIPDANFKTKLIALGIDVNADGEIQSAEAFNVTSLDLTNASITDLTGIAAFANLTTLNLFLNEINALDVSGLSNLNTLMCAGNHMHSLNISGTNLQYLDCSLNSITSLDLSGQFSLLSLDCASNMLTSLDISGLFNIKDILCNGNMLTSLNVSGLSTLQQLDISQNAIPTIDLSGLPNLKSFMGYNAQIQSLNLTGLNNLETLECGKNSLSSLDLSGLISLKKINCSENSLATLDLVGLPQLQDLNCANNLLTALDVNALTTLKYINCGGNQLTVWNVSALVNLIQLSCGFNQLSTLDLTTLTNLTALDFSSNTISSINLANNNSLTFLNCSNNQLTTLDVSNLTQLITFACNNNAIPDVDFSGLTQLRELFIESTGRTAIDITNQPLLTYLGCADNPISVVDVSSLANLNGLSFGGPSLTQVFMKNGGNEALNVPVPCPNLQFVCADESELPYILSVIVPSGASAATVTSYCSFTPGGDYNTITGHSRFDLNNNGCDASDIPTNNMRIAITSGTTTEASVVNPSAQYAFYTGAGDFTVMPQLENPGYFNVDPISANLSFPVLDSATQLQDFCISANGIHPDLEIVLMPAAIARPGFDAAYEIVYKNKGNQTLSGTVNLVFDDSRTDYTGASPAADNQSLNTLLWNYVDLKPFESRVIDLHLNINSPLETPAVIAGDILDFTASINFAQGDDTPDDNVSILHQTVMNAMDPNSKSCLEGATVSTEHIGKYLHYKIEFENLGNAEAVNVVVKDIIDTTKFDVNTLQVLYASNPMRAVIKQDAAEFIFENINLPPRAGDPPVGGHGSILFKIKTLNSLTAEAEVTNQANIYFDYNHPVDTNVARTIFTQLDKDKFDKDESVSIYPNPVKDFLRIGCDNTIKSIELYDIQGRLIETQLIGKKQSQLDFSSKANGIYFIRINTANGKKVEKIIKR